MENVKDASSSSGKIGAKAQPIPKEDIKEMIENPKKDYPMWLFDPGHGGIIDEEYQTSGKRSPKWEDGRQLFEGEFNRAIVSRVIKLMDKAEYPCMNTMDMVVERSNKYKDTREDIPLKERTYAANDYYTNVSENCILASFHANAGGGTGHETYTSPGWTEADPFATEVINELISEFPELRLRKDDKDGDNDKEAKFWMVMQTYMPSFLMEFAFMDTLNPDCLLLLSPIGRDRFASAVFRAITTINEAA